MRALAFRALPVMRVVMMAFIVLWIIVILFIAVSVFYGHATGSHPIQGSSVGLTAAFIGMLLFGVLLLAVTNHMTRVFLPRILKGMSDSDEGA